MKKLLDCFDYLKKYQSDILDVLSIMFELFSFKKECPTLIFKLISKAHKRKSIRDEFNTLLKELVGDKLYVPINDKVNILKILKSLHYSDVNLNEVKHFIHIISQRRTTNKLYYYSTPKEVNDLFILLLDLKDGDEVYNPCYGIGSIFLSIGNLDINVKLYGEEIDDRIFKVANLIAKFALTSEYDLRVNNALKYPIFQKNNNLMKFDKVICNPPLYADIELDYLRNDERFSKVGILTTNYPELIFLKYAIFHLKTKGVFIVRNQTLQKGFVEDDLREKLVKDGLIEAVIELPKNIFPHQGCDFSILVISHNNNKILHINASGLEFYIKDGKYNKLINIEKIANFFKDKVENQYSKSTKLNDININDLRASHYLNALKKNNTIRLGDFNLEIFRGQRVYGSNKDMPIEYYDVGIADFSPCGFSSYFENKKIMGDTHKIHKYRLKPYDILLSLRGTAPKTTILSKDLDGFIAIANAGILILRFENKNDAISLYCYFFSQKGFELLSNIYKKSGENAINVDDLLDIMLPVDYSKDFEFKFLKIEELRYQFEILDAKLERLKQS